MNCLLKSIKRRIKPTPSIRSPWKIQVKSNLHSTLFWEFYRAVKNWSSEFGRTLHVEKKKNGFPKAYTITFFHKGTFEYHLSQGTGESVKKHLKKKLKGGAVGQVAVSEEKPVVLKHNISRAELTLNIFYEIINRYGNSCI